MSYENKKELVKLISYMATFDGGLYRGKCRNGKDLSNARYVMNMRKENLDYVEWVRDTLLNVTNAKIVDRKDYNTDGFKRAPQVTVSSSNHPFLTTLWERIYIDKKKVLDPYMLKMMDAEALAIIFMADGGTALDTRSRNPHGKITLNTKGFSHGDNVLLSKAIYETLGIRSNIHKHKQYRYLSIKTADVLKFVDIISPFVKPSFYYKLERLAPYIMHKGGDIVWTMPRGIEEHRDEAPSGECH